MHNNGGDGDGDGDGDGTVTLNFDCLDPVRDEQWQHWQRDEHDRLRGVAREHAQAVYDGNPGGAADLLEDSNTSTASPLNAKISANAMMLRQGLSRSASEQGTARDNIAHAILKPGLLGWSGPAIENLATASRQAAVLELVPSSTLLKSEHLSGGRSLCDVLLVTYAHIRDGESVEQTSVIKVGQTQQILTEYQHAMLLSSVFPERTGIARPLRAPVSYADCSAIELEFVDGQSVNALWQVAADSTTPAFRAALRDSFGPGGIIFNLRSSTAQRGYADPNEKSLEFTASTAPIYFSEELRTSYEAISSMPLHDLMSVGHNDMHAGNLMVRDEDSAVLLIDCNSAGYGPILKDHATMLCKFLLEPDLITTDAQYESTKELISGLFPVNFHEDDLDVYSLPDVTYKNAWEFPLLKKMTSMALQLLSYIGPLISAAGGKPTDHHPKYFYATTLQVVTRMASYKQAGSYDGRIAMYLCSRLIEGLGVFHLPGASGLSL